MEIIIYSAKWNEKENMFFFFYSKKLYAENF